MSDDKRQISMPLAIYNEDLEVARINGRIEASRRFAKIIKASKEDPTEAVCIISEDFEGDQASIDKMLIALGLMDLAQKIWSAPSMVPTNGWKP